MTSILTKALPLPTTLGLNLVDPLSLLSIFVPPLPVVGLITSTAALIYAYCESIFLGPLSDPSVPPATIRSVWRKCFLPGFVIVIGARAGSIASGIAGYLASPSPSESPAGILYLVGVGFTVMHFAFLPWASAALDPVLNQPPTPELDAKIHENSQKFFRLDTVRTFASEVPAFLCFLGATLTWLKL